MYTATLKLAGATQLTLPESTFSAETPKVGTVVKVIAGVQEAGAARAVGVENGPVFDPSKPNIMTTFRKNDLATDLCE
jgi:hypothetical protein